MLIGQSLPLMEEEMSMPANHLYALALNQSESHNTTRPPDKPLASEAAICQVGNIFLK